VTVSAAELSAAAERIAPHVRRTPMTFAGAGARLKLESLQPTGSFKVRGFFNAALSLDPEQLARGLMTVSAGNAALAVAHVARELGVPCRVVMYETAPAVKIDGVHALGGATLLMPRERMVAWMADRGWTREPETFIHPFADDAIIAGHATLAAAIVEDWPEVERVIVPVGGGGLISGIAEGMAAIAPHVRVVGAQSDGYAQWSRVFAAGGPVALSPDTIADGTTAPFHPAMFDRLRANAIQWVVVPEQQVRDEVRRLCLETKIVVEGAGALAAAALRTQQSDARSVAVVSGGNIDPKLLSALVTG